MALNDLLFRNLSLSEIVSCENASGCVSESGHVLKCSQVVRWSAVTAVLRHSTLTVSSCQVHLMANGTARTAPLARHLTTATLSGSNSAVIGSYAFFFLSKN